MSTQLGAQDAQFLYLQTDEVLTHVMSINVYDGRAADGRQLRYADIVRHVSERCHLSPVYGRKLHRLPGDLDFPYWVEDASFVPADHITRVRLPRPGGWPEFCRLVARRFAQPMDLGRPLWDIQVVAGLDTLPGAAPGSFALLQRFHHAAIDGASGAYALAALSDSDAHGTPMVAAPPPGQGSAIAPTRAAAVYRALASGVTAPARMLDAALRISPALVAAARRRIEDDSRREHGGVPVTRFNQRVAKKRSFAATEFKLAALQSIRTAVAGATINDVILAVCSGALRAYLTSHGELPLQSLVAIAPINARRIRGGDASAGNNVSAMTVPLATQIAEPLARLRAIYSATRDAKAAKSGVGARLLADVGRHLPGAPLAGFARLLGNERFARSQANLVITNVPSSRQALYLHGALLTHQFGMGPVTHGLGLFIAANGYHDTIAICLSADSGLLPDLEFLCSCVEESFADLAAASRAGARVRNAKRRPAARARH
jgi:WS/DGAT/MGAT family acyltransferase